MPLNGMFVICGGVETAFDKMWANNRAGIKNLI